MLLPPAAAFSAAQKALQYQKKGAQARALRPDGASRVVQSKPWCLSASRCPQSRMMPAVYPARSWPQQQGRMNHLCRRDEKNANAHQVS